MMERAVAIKKLGKLLGKNLGYRVDVSAPKPEDREAARNLLRKAIEERKAVEERAKERRKQVLAADAEYCDLNARYDLLRKQVDELQSVSMHYKITVGTSNSIFFHVHAQGDSWEEVIAKVEKETGTRPPRTKAGAHREKA